MKPTPVPPTLYIEGPAFWTPTLPGWNAARAAFRGEGGLADPPAKRPSPQVLAPAERRRAPDTVALALEVAAASMAGAGRNAADVPCVFVSAHGDLSINDYMCSTLATDPTVLSPTRFHNSVHNAAVGYWTIGTGCMAASNSVSAYENSFAAGLLEAAVQCAADQSPVLLVGYDTPTVGPLTSVTDSQGLLAVALVIAPERTAHTVAALDWSVQDNGGDGTVPAPLSDAAKTLAHINPMAHALGLFEALARLEGDPPPPIGLPLSSALSLRLQLQRVRD
ncbi:beta-ketoacyl synthase domain-containing protein [Variovorax paradoxus B4]|uniref:Beta-ketoacyl synthase domain-containing protein n=1 Tax=Variovorax paradoxus B4 TaxID=1246301 RepID=T1X4B7_VARPD|nr:beta-ketoacyl synthase chain length factor [Variovorax paradoxus]AGU47448.1 beta-ketoacyl synthase domain-containing protein [Variovorax paradoxus B4]